MTIKTTFPFPRTPLTLACMLLPLMASPVGAASAPTEVEEVIVTSSKRDQRLQDFSGAASVITHLSLTKTIAELAAQVPGLTIIDAGPRNPAGLVIRGLRMEEMGANDLGGDGSLVASYVDNIPLQGYFVPPSFSLKDLQQVEVLRGPQGTLYGNASVGGLIRYVTAKPDLSKYSVTLGGEVSQTKHSDDLSYDMDLVVNTPLIDDTLALRLLLGTTDNAGFIDNPYLLSGAQEDINDDQTSVARVSLLWQANDDLSFNTSYHYQQLDVGDRQAANKDFTGDKYTASSRYLQPVEGELQLLSLDTNYAMGWATLTGSLNRYAYDHHERADQTDMYIAMDPDGTNYNAYEDLRAYNASTVDVVKESAEVRLVSDNDRSLRWLAGAFYSRDDLDVFIGDYLPGFSEFLGEELPNDLEYGATQTEVLDEYSFYGEVAYDVTERWEIGAGVRDFRYKDDLEVCITYFPSDGVPLCEVGDDSLGDTLGKFSTKYTFSNEHSAYFVVAEGYRRGGANRTPPEVTTDRFYSPDKSTDYELGWRSDMLNNRLQLNAALFVMEWKDIQIQTLSEDGRNITANASTARSQGVELEMTAQLTPAFSLRGNYAYAHAELTNTVEDIAAYKGDQLPGSPRYRWSLALDYSQAWNSATIDGSLEFRQLGSLYTALNEEYASYRKLDGYNTLNARLGVTLRNWQVGAYVNNITNTRGVTGGRFDDYFGAQGVFEYVSRPRTIGLMARYSY